VYKDDDAEEIRAMLNDAIEDGDSYPYEGVPAARPFPHSRLAWDGVKRKMKKRKRGGWGYPLHVLFFCKKVMGTPLPPSI